MSGERVARKPALRYIMWNSAQAANKGKRNSLLLKELNLTGANQDQWKHVCAIAMIKSALFVGFHKTDLDD